MNANERAACRARADAATAGEWILTGLDTGWSEVAATDTWFRLFPDRDADFIAHARADVPALLDDIERLRAALDAVEWLPYSDGLRCPWCYGRKSRGHAPSCLRQAALA